MVLRIRFLFIVAFASLVMAGCASSQLATGDIAAADPVLPESADFITEAQLQFTEGNFGKAVDAYAKTVEVDPTNADAWLGLAASYDHVGRFDQADKAYERAQSLVGPTPSILNNLGYSYLMRGHLEKSRTTLEAARNADPDNPYILNNIDILNDRLANLGKNEVSAD